MSTITRRRFLKGSIAAGAISALPYSKVAGANDDIRVAVVGIRNQGANHINLFRKIRGVRVVAVCDADKNILDREVKKFTDRNERVDGYIDFRRILDDKNIDAVVTATPNHWHALVTIWSCQAGKDVYVEKPVCHNIYEGRQMVRAARKYNRIVQSGTQRRSDGGLRRAIDYIQQGHLGKIKLARGLCYVRRGSIGKVGGPQSIPRSVDYDLWCGPAAKEPLMRKNLHYDWHWVWPTGSGDLGNNGIHFMDVCRWVVGADKLPPRVISIGGRFGYVDDGRTPNPQIIYLDYEPAPIIYEVRGLSQSKGSSVMDNYRGIRIDVVIQCEGGYLAGGWVYDNDGKKIEQFVRGGGGGHHANFIKAVRSRKTTDLNADILEGHLSSSLCHMGNISHRLGKEAGPGEIAESVKGNKDMVEAFGRLEEHLAANEVNFKQTPRILGVPLEFDGETERFTGAHSDAANALLTRDYRKPFVVPEKV